MLSKLPLPRRLSTPSYLFALVAAVVIPLLAFAAFLLTRYAATERARFEAGAAQLARQIGLIVDGELAGLVAVLNGLATSSALAENKYDQFYLEARRLVLGTDQIIVLRDLARRQFLNTQLPFGSGLPPAIPITPAESASFAAGRPVISEVYLSPVSGEARVAAAIPVFRDSRPEYILAITVPTSRILRALAPAVPPGWIIGVGDRDGTYVARSERHEEFTGKPGLPEYLAKATGRSGTFTSSNFDGIELLAGYHRSDFSGWFVAANIPRAAVEAPLWKSLSMLAILGAAALSLSAALAYQFGRGFTAAAKGLAERAAALGDARPVSPISTRLTEFRAVGDVLVAAAQTISQRRQERERAEEALRERTHELETVLATVPAAVWFTYDPQGKQVVRNRLAAELVPVSGADGEFGQLSGAMDGVPRPQDGIAVQESPLRRAMRGERVQDEEYTVRLEAGRSCTLLTSATALRDESGAIIGAVSVSLDITERKRSEEHRRLLIHELNHRVKNTLATVQSIALHTLRGATSTKQAQEALSDRLVALAKAHDVLTRENWEGAELADIVSGATAPHAGRDRIVINGPPVRLPPALSLSLALALHELATNAAKYGALSAEAGAVDISWEVANGAGDSRVKLRWLERGGPRVEPPQRHGFGTRLIRRSLSAEFDGAAQMDYAPEGICCVLEATIRAPSAEQRSLHPEARS